MPHQCTACGRTFDDGSKEMLSGCPDCGGNKFQFMPASAVDEAAGGTGGAATTPKKAPEPSGSSASDRGAVETEGKEGSSAVGRAAATVREWVSTREDREESSSTGSTARGSPSTRNDPRSDEGSSSDRSSTPADQAPTTEDSAQASARRDVVSKAELPDEPPQNSSISNSEDRPDDSNVVDAPADENPGLKELREELNSQFESIRIVNPGQYELNLMELYEREEYIISLQEDGKYVIEVPDAWDQTDR
jgi:predicted  nucleic acid-binding Zn-ribbon protein